MAIIFLLLALAGISFYLWNSYQTEIGISRLEAIFKTPEATGPAVYAMKEIKQGDVISDKSLVVKTIPISKMPDHIACRLEEVVGRKARFAVASDSIVSLYDLDPYPSGLPIYVVTATKDIEKGKVIEENAVGLEQEFAEKVPDHSFERTSMVVGTWAAKDISKDQILKPDDIFP